HMFHLLSKQTFLMARLYSILLNEWHLIFIFEREYEKGDHLVEGPYVLSATTPILFVRTLLESHFQYLEPGGDMVKLFVNKNFHFQVSCIPIRLTQYYMALKILDQ
ncbi:hypothetical protein ACJX0J_028913, partial [Zea mays]